MERRTFLGAAAALAALPADVVARDDDMPDGGSGADDPRPSVRRSHSGVWSHSEVAVGGIDEDTDLRVSGYHYPDYPEDSGVEIVLDTGTVLIHADVSPERARELAEDFSAAAAFADGEFDADD